MSNTAFGRRSTFVVPFVFLALAVPNVWAQQAQTERVFDAGNSNPINWSFVDWAPGDPKAECVSGGTIVGLSGNFFSQPQYQAHSVLCRSPVSTPLTLYQANPEDPHHERAEYFLGANSADYGSHGGDWDVGFFKGECPPGGLATGVGQTLAGQLSSLWCSQSTTAGAEVSAPSCHTEMFPGNHEWPSYASPMDWSFGFDKLICNSGEVVAGVSVDGNQHPHAILCCGLVKSPWAKISASFPGLTGPQNLQLLMDGSILASDLGQRHAWYRFVPSSLTGYPGGSWTGPFFSHYGRSYFASGMLKDGKFFIGGGEYIFRNDATGTPINNCTFGQCAPGFPGEPDISERSHCEVFDPTTNVWTNVPDYTNSTSLADGVVAPLTDGRLLVGAAYKVNLRSSNPVCRAIDNHTCDPGDRCVKGQCEYLTLGAESMIFDSTNANPWSSAHSLGTGLVFAEGSLALMQNNLVLLAQSGGLSTYRTQGGPFWTSTIPAPANNPALNGEGASALTLYSGNVLILGASGYNAIYNPNVPNTVVNVSASPGSVHFVPQGPELREGFHENYQVVMPTGNALVAGTTDGSSFRFYEYNEATDRFTNVSTAGPGDGLFGAVAQTPLPDGTVMVGGLFNKDLYIYSPGGSQAAKFGKPSISSITGPSSGVYTLTGTMLNGLTNGASCDDEGQNYTSFPVVSLSWKGVLGLPITAYAVGTSVSTMSIAPNATNTVKFRLPSGIPHLASVTVAVSASGFRSSNAGRIIAP